MNVEETIKKCEIYSKQIKQYDPDPFYIDYFFTKYIDSVNEVFDLIFEEASKDFGLFILEKSTQEKFLEKAKIKNDKNAIKFSEWYLKKFNQEHENPLPNAIKKICNFKNKSKKIPEIKIMIRASERYKDDVNQEIKINLRKTKIIRAFECQCLIRIIFPNTRCVYMYRNTISYILYIVQRNTSICLVCEMSLREHVPRLLV